MRMILVHLCGPIAGWVSVRTQCENCGDPHLGVNGSGTGVGPDRWLKTFDEVSFGSRKIILLKWQKASNYRHDWKGRDDTCAASLGCTCSRPQWSLCLASFDRSHSDTCMWTICDFLPTLVIHRISCLGRINLTQIIHRPISTRLGTCRTCYAVPLRYDAWRFVGINPFIIAALWNRADHYIFALWFLLSSFCLSFVFPRLISAVAYWMSAILPHMVWP